MVVGIIFGVIFCVVGVFVCCCCCAACCGAARANSHKTSEHHNESEDHFKEPKDESETVTATYYAQPVPMDAQPNMAYGYQQPVQQMQYDPNMVQQQQMQ